MALSLKEQLHDFLDTHALIGRDRDVHFVVAYSGGRDSTALLHSLAQLKSESTFNIRLTAAYYWHPWRPLQEDLQVVYQNCKALTIQWVMLTPDLNLPKTETAARHDRYQQLAKLAFDLDATAVLTGHHQDDNVETILFRILRGTGVEGLLGIPEVRTIPLTETQEVVLARPFINTPRTEINDYVATHQLHYTEDPTNVELGIKRNFLRHELIPKIESAFPQARQSLIRLSELTEGELEIIHTKMEEVWRDIFDPQTRSLDEVRFNQLAHPFQRRVIRRYLEEAGEESNYNKVEEVITFIGGKKRDAGQPGLLSLGPNRFISLYRNRISIESPKKVEVEPVKVTIPGEVSHVTLKATVSITPLTPEQRLRPIDFSKLSEEEAYVDLSSYVGQELTFRARKTGDRIKPLGMSAPVKLKRFFINRCVPRFKRDMVPLLATDSEVLWAVGVGISDTIRVKNAPTHRITIIKRG